MKKLNLREVMIPALALFLICSVVTALLAITNNVTAPLIAKIQVEKQNEACQRVLPAANSFIQDSSNPNFYIGLDANSTAVGCAIITTAKGYGGDIEVMTGISIDGTVTGVQILSMNETPGLGANANKESFLSQYIGGNSSRSVTKDGGDVQALTGATITSRAVTAAVNEAIEIHKNM